MSPQVLPSLRIQREFNNIRGSNTRNVGRVCEQEYFNGIFATVRAR